MAVGLEISGGFRRGSRPQDNTHPERVPMTMTSTADKPTEWHTEWLRERNDEDGGGIKRGSNYKDARDR